MPPPKNRCLARQEMEERNLLDLYDSLPQLFEKHRVIVKTHLTESLLTDIHAIAVKGIVDWSPGRFRFEDVEIIGKGGQVEFKPPDYLRVNRLFK